MFTIDPFNYKLIVGTIAFKSNACFNKYLYIESFTALPKNKD